MVSDRPVRVELARKSDCTTLAQIYCRTILPTQPQDHSKTLAESEANWADNFQGLVECSAGLHPHEALVKAVRPAKVPDGKDPVVGFALWWLKRRKGKGEDSNKLVGLQRELV